MLTPYMSQQPLYSPTCTSEQQDLILSYPIFELVSKNPRKKKAMTEAGIVSTVV